MSWKGFTKSVTRAPQTFKAKFNMGENTKDAIYIDAERRFQEMETETKKLHDETKKYFDAINGMLNHQIGFSNSVAEIYKPISGRMSDPTSFVVDGNPEGIQACEEYEAIMKELQVTLAPELEMIETRIIRPADELLDVVKIIRKVTTKRQHKQIDYDRHRATLKKLQDKPDKTLKDEKAMYKAEADVEQATQEFEFFNDLLKDELPKLFQLEQDFIKPLFQSFYYMQLNVFYTLHEKMQALDIGYFDLTLDVEEAFNKKRGDVKEQAEALSIVKFRTSGARASHLNNKYNKYGKKAEANANAGHRKSMTDADMPPPPYSSEGTEIGAEKSAGGLGRSNTTGRMSAVGKAKPPPPKPKPKMLAASPAVETVTALYDYEAQAEGDLSFSTGDVIEIIQRTNNENEWWTGKVHGRTGQFPGNYVKLQ